MRLNENSRSRPARVALETLGCKLNQAESETLARLLKSENCLMVDFTVPADIYIVNSCAVTHVAGRKTRHLLRMARRLNPESKIVLLGCYAEESGHPAGVVPEADLIIDNSDKPLLVERLKELGWISSFSATGFLQQDGRTRSFIKAQDGCNNFCSYCIVPLVRGREKSLPPDTVISAINQRVAEGYHEVVLTGTEIGRYRSAGLDITGLLSRILAETAIERLRLSSLQPQEITAELLALWRDSRLCPHFHLSLQSGSDTVLKRMQRRYSSREYLDKVDFLRRTIPDVSITTDIIVGFPGETDEEFSESYNLCAGMQFSRIHVFSYSVRPGTAAAAFKPQVPAAVKKLRSERMLELAERSLRDYHSRFLGCLAVALLEQKDGGFWSGYTERYIKVYIKSSADLTNQIKNVRLLEIQGDGLLAEII
jgi:threonylcarbamoyladenosine tRNA methylthiotransferase MtaB